jgi:hypothetical protein
MRLKQLGQELVNLLGVIAATLMYVFVYAWILSFQSPLSGQVSGALLIWIVPLLIECLVAAGAGAALGLLLRTDRPVVYAILFGSALVVWRWTSMTIGHPRWQDALWITLDVLLPAFVATAVTLWLCRRREARAPR